MLVFQSTDFAQHRPLERYRRIDAIVGEAREVMRAEGAVAVVSDHGFGPHPRISCAPTGCWSTRASWPRAARPGAEST